MSFAETCRELIKTGEGSISHMYLDTRGFVTVGVENMMRTAAEAQALTFVRREDGNAATDEEIAADFDAIKNRPYGQSYTARSFKEFTKLDMPDAEIDALLDRRIAGFEAGLRDDFPGFDDYPDRAKLGLIDMAFNLGNHGLVTKFPTFTAAARAHDWAVCAEQCRRRGISATRNEEVKKLFEEADNPI